MIQFEVTYEDGTTEVFDTEKEAQAQVSKCENAFYTVLVYDDWEAFDATEEVRERIRITENPYTTMLLRHDKEKINIANVILDIVDREKRFVISEDCEGGVEELRMQLREVAFALILGKEVSPDMLR